jgi:UDPglucose--hexose-1-phosphate uridylyltransferase
MSEFRKDPVAGRWVVFAPERKLRPQPAIYPAHFQPLIDPFAEGYEKLTPHEVYAVRASHLPANGPGWKVRVVPNRYPALHVEGELLPEAIGFYDKMNGIGAHEVIIETTDPKLALEDQSLDGIAEVLKAWRSRMLDLQKDGRFQYLLIFKNVGSLAGATMRHAHSQLMALPVTPRAVKEKLASSQAYFEEKDRNIFEDVLHNEVQSGERLVCDNSGFVVFCPFASRLPFELCIMPRLQSPDFYTTNDHELMLLAESLKTSLSKLSLALDRPNYNLVVHTAPLRRPRKNHWETIEFDYRWHIEILPRLSGIAGFEFGTGFYINTTLPEEAALFLRQTNASP